MSTADGKAAAAALELALQELGLPGCRVEARDRLAIIIPDASAWRGDLSSYRADAVREGRRLGFTHVALEIPASPSPHAALSRD